jgi:hypothetical protein
MTTITSRGRRPGVALAFALLSAGTAHAQGRSQEFPLKDNSFFVEEAFNQEPGKVQTRFRFFRVEDDTELRIGQEWPLGSRRHQLSYTLPFRASEEEELFELTDVRLTYSLQAQEEGPGRPAFAPRLTAIFPTAEEEDREGQGNPGIELLLPFSKRVGDLYLHANLGMAHRFGVEAGLGEEALLFTPFLGGSAVVQVTPGLNLLLETRAEFQEQVTGLGSTDRETKWLLNPGVRFGRQFGDNQLVAGAAAPLGLAGPLRDVGFFGYISYELRFRR